MNITQPLQQQLSKSAIILRNDAEEAENKQPNKP